MQQVVQLVARLVIRQVHDKSKQWISDYKQGRIQTCGSSRRSGGDLSRDTENKEETSRHKFTVKYILQEKSIVTGLQKGGYSSF